MPSFAAAAAAWRAWFDCDAAPVTIAVAPSATASPSASSNFRVLLLRFAKDELEHAGLIAAESQTGQVFAFDEDPDVADGFREAWSFVERRRQSGHSHTRQFGDGC